MQEIPRCASQEIGRLTSELGQTRSFGDVRSNVRFAESGHGWRALVTRRGSPLPKISPRTAFKQKQGPL
jgi:hypothetical protein